MHENHRVTLKRALPPSLSSAFSFPDRGLRENLAQSCSGLSFSSQSDKWKILLFHLNLTTASGWHRHQRRAIMELCVCAKQYRAVNERFSQLVNEMPAIALVSPSFPCQG